MATSWGRSNAFGGGSGPGGGSGTPSATATGPRGTAESEEELLGISKQSRSKLTESRNSIEIRFCMNTLQRWRVPPVLSIRVWCWKKFCGRNGSGSLLYMLDHLRKYQQILFDLTANYLEPLQGGYQRLAYISSLRDPATGKYVNEALESVYGAEAVDQVIANCHEEVFERLLEMPLNAQKEDLEMYLSSLSGTLEGNVLRCRETCSQWAPPKAPSYLTELYRSNLGVLLELLQDDTSTALPNS